MSWKCSKCKYKLNGTEKKCPNCKEKIVYECKKCKKVLDDGKYKFCPLCRTQKTEKHNKVIKKAGAVAGTVTSLAILAVTGGKFGKKQ